MISNEYHCFNLLFHGLFCSCYSLSINKITLLGGEENLGGGWEGKVTEGEGTWVGVSKISILDDGVTEVG